MRPCLVRPHLLHGCKLILGPLTHDRPVYTYTCVLKHTPVFFWTYVYCPNGPTFWDRNGRNDSTAILDGLKDWIRSIDAWAILRTLRYLEIPETSPQKDEQRRCSVFHSQARASWPWSFHQRQGQRVVWSSQWISVLIFFPSDFTKLLESNQPGSTKDHKRSIVP